MSTPIKMFKAICAKTGAAVKKASLCVWRYLKVAKMEYIVMVALFAVDLISKWIVNATTSVGQTVVLIPYVLNVHNIHNYNAAFGASWMTDWLGQTGARVVYCVFAIAASFVFILILVRIKGGPKLFSICIAMLTAGAMGNCIDRWALGYVRDFVEFVYFGLTIWGKKSFYIFNLADAYLVVGVILLIIYFLFIYKDTDDGEKKSKRRRTVTQTTTAAGETEFAGGDPLQNNASGGDVTHGAGEKSVGTAASDPDGAPFDPNGISAETEGGNGEPSDGVARSDAGDGGLTN